MEWDGELLSETEADALIKALASGQDIFTDEDLDILEKWATECKLNEILLKVVTEGHSNVFIRHGKVHFISRSAPPVHREADISSDAIGITEAMRHIFIQDAERWWTGREINARLRVLIAEGKVRTNAKKLCWSTRRVFVDLHSYGFIVMHKEPGRGIKYRKAP